MSHVRTDIQRIVEAALFLAITFIIARLEFRIWPQGGSVNIFILPLVLYAVRNGVKWGLLTGTAYGILSIMWASFLYHPLSGLLDFIVPAAATGLAGLLRGDFRAYWGILLAGSVGMASYVLSGVFIFGHFMPEVFLGIPMGNVLFYAFLYNATYVIPSMLLSLFVLSLIHKPLRRFILRQDLAEGGTD